MYVGTTVTPNEYFTPLSGQSLLIPGQSEQYRGQCVQSVGLWIQKLGLQFPAYLYAYLYYDNGIPGYSKIPRGTDNPKVGDIIVWGKNFPDSPNAGHIDVCSQNGTWADFWGWDSNWSPPLKLNKIHHTAGNQYIVGLLRKGADMPYTDEQYNTLKADRDSYAEDWAREYYVLAGLDPTKITQADRQARVGLTWQQAVTDLSKDLPIPAKSSPFELEEQIKDLKSQLSDGEYVKVTDIYIKKDAK